ncbi:MAG TPA: 30S ribosome-binding factor RbfA [Anaerolineaceae bacterium]|nr:30S ribosome-binding factor RbfA [Anaerolineaceae bacterium]HPS32473.1 30S ribosome-binding factor RbfA [Anaerolineaceae bacterium]
MPTPLRMKRINDRVKEILSLTLLNKIEDPRLTGVNITDVKVDRELDFANVYVSAPEGRVREREVLEALNHARGFLKFELANEIDLRVMPRLRFFWDPTPERADRIDTLLAQLRDESDQVGEAADEGEDQESND